MQAFFFLSIAGIRVLANIAFAATRDVVTRDVRTKKIFLRRGLSAGDDSIAKSITD